MGNGSSTTRVRRIPLVPQSRFPHVVNQRCVFDKELTLRMRDQFWTVPDQDTGSFEARNADTNEVVFKVRPPGSSSTKPMLLDAKGVPLVQMNGYTVALNVATYLPFLPLTSAVQEQTARPNALCYIETCFKAFEKRLWVDLSTPNQQFIIKFDGVWEEHAGVFNLECGKTLQQCIGRVSCPPKDKKSKKKDHRKTYLLDVAPGVDAALLVLICAALDEELARKNKTTVADIGTDPVTKELAERHTMLNYANYESGLYYGVGE